MKQSNKPQHLQLHTIIGALSYWGATTRLLLVGFVLLMASLLHLVGRGGEGMIEYIESFVFALGALVILDVGYVAISRVYTFSARRLDQAIFLLLYLALALLIILPYFFVMSINLTMSISWLFLTVLFGLLIRLVTGMFFGNHVQNK